MRAWATDQHQAMEHSQALRNTIIWVVAAIIAGALVHAVIGALAPAPTAAAAGSFESTIMTGLGTITGWVSILAIPVVALMATWHALMRA